MSTTALAERGKPFKQQLAKMRGSTVVLAMWLILTVAVTLTVVSANPIQRQKRQSDQRIAELETLLALQKLGQQRLRDWGRVREMSPPGYGLIDFDKIGRRKKSTRFSPGGAGEDEDKVWNSWLSQSLDSRPLSNLETGVDQK